MTAMLPVALYGLKVPAGDVMIPAAYDFPATFRITMAAVDPTAAPEHTGSAGKSQPARATLKIVWDPDARNYTDSEEDSEDEDSELGDDQLKALLARVNGEDEDDEDEDEDEEDEDESSDEEGMNGGPSDPSKSEKARKNAAAKQLLEALAENGEVSDDGMDVDEVPKTNGISKKTQKPKGKGKGVELLDATAEEDEDEEDEDGLSDGMKEHVVCSLDPEKHYQQPLDLTVPEGQTAFFKVSGTHAVYLTGNYVVHDDNQRPYDDMKAMLDEARDEDSDEYDLEPDEDELDYENEDDELDDLEDPRITEVDSEDEKEAPALVIKPESKKGKNKRPAEDSEDEPANLDAIMAKSLKPEEKAVDNEPKLSKKQQKKLKKNDGKAAPVVDAQPSKTQESKEKTDKKVSFAKELEQPATSSAKVNGENKTAQKQDSKTEAAKPGVKVVQGVKIDDKKIGSGPSVKKGNKVGLRYIGKLKDGKVFDANKKGPSFKFKIGAGEVIKGWDIGVEGMAVGGERRIIIPANLAYGKQKMAGIPANSELTFDLKLLEIL